MRIPTLVIAFACLVLFLGFGASTIKDIDILRNNTASNITLDPDTDVIVTSLSNGNRALTSGSGGELKESATTDTEVGYLSGVTSSVQTQIDSKADSSMTISTTSPLSGGGDLSANRTLSIPQADTSTDGYLSSTDWDTFNNKSDGLSGLTDDTMLRANGTTSVESTGITIDGSDQILDAAGLAIGAATLDTATLFDVVSTTQASRPFPSMTETQRDNITSPQEGSFVFNTDTGKINQYSDSVWEEVSGSGGGGGDPYSIGFVKADDLKTDDVTETGNNASFNGGGTLVGEITKETKSLYTGATESFFYSANSLNGENDYFGFECESVSGADKKYPYKLTVNYETLNAVDDDFVLNVYQYDSSDTLLTSETLNIDADTTGEADAKLGFWLAGNVDYIVYGFQNTATTTNIGLYFDKLVIDRASNELDLYNITDWDSFTPTGSWTSGATYTGKFRQVGDVYVFQVRLDITGSVTSSNLSINLPSSMEIDTDKLVSSDDFRSALGLSYLRDNSAGINRNGRVMYKDSTSVTIGYETADNQAIPTDSSPWTWASGDIITANFSVPIKNATATTEATVTDGQGLMQTEAWDTHDGYGSVATRIPYFLNQKTDQTKGSGLFEITNDSTDGMQIKVLRECYLSVSFSSSYTAANTFGISLNASVTTDVQNLAASDKLAMATTSSAAYAATASFQKVKFSAGDIIRPHANNLTAQEFSKWHITVSASPTAQNINVITPAKRVAYIKDVKSSGTDGGDFNSGAWRRRDLNTTEGDSFVSLSSDQFTLPAGTYEIDASAPAYKVNRHQIRVRNVTDSTTEILGSSEYCNDSTSAQTRSFLSGEIEIDKTTTFEVQHRCTTTKTGGGLGMYGGFTDEVYTIVKIEKIL